MYGCSKYIEPQSKELAKGLEKKLNELNKFKKVEIAGPGFINISLDRKTSFQFR